MSPDHKLGKSDLRAARAAVDAYVQPIQDAFLSVVPVSVAPVGQGYIPRREPYELRFNNNQPIVLGSDPRLFMSASQQYRVMRSPIEPGRFKVRILKYIYELRNMANQRIVAFHWHPTMEFKPTHMHIGVGAGMSLFPGLEKAHIPGGRVLVEDMLELTIDKLGVTPQKGVRAAKAAFERTRQRFLADATWGQPADLDELFA